MYNCGTRGLAVVAASSLTRCFRRRKTSGGVTLIETLVAFSMVAVCLGVISELTFWSLGESISARRRAQAALVVQERMEDLLAHRADLAAWTADIEKKSSEVKKELYAQKPDPQPDLYVFDAKGRPELVPFYWGCTIAPVEGQPGLQNVHIQLTWQRPGIHAPWARHDLQTLIAVSKNLPAKPAVAMSVEQGGTK